MGQSTPVNELREVHRVSEASAEGRDGAANGDDAESTWMQCIFYEALPDWVGELAM